MRLDPGAILNLKPAKELLQGKEPSCGNLTAKLQRMHGPWAPIHPLLGHSQPEAFLTSFTHIFTSEELNGEITGAGNPTEPFALSCRAERQKGSLFLRRW